MEIRHAIPDDVMALTDIYNHYIEHSTITFDIVPKTVEERSVWLQKFTPDTPHQLLVAIEDSDLIGYAGSMQFRTKRAYDTSVETTVYLRPTATGRGLGVRLYEALFRALSCQGLNRAYAGITLPNAASVALHKKVGFSDIGTFSQAGYKFDTFWDVAWMERSLSSSAEA